MAFTTGENVGSYRVMEKLGRGGMATVYKAHHARLDRYVALKVLHPAFLEDPNFLARFQREAQLVAKLEHPNIVPVYDFAEHDEQPYLVMKYIEGDTLKADLNQGRLSVDEIWKVVEAVGAGLGHAHKEGILHRDIKPSNVIMAKDGKAYLTDFGLARIAEMGESTLSGDMIMGTPQYISPEQAKGEKDLDNRTDIYSFGVMLYEMVVGQVPFSADTPFSIIHDHIYSPLPLPHLINPSVPDEVERVLLKALAKDREDRYESVEALNFAFKKAWDDSDVDMAEATMTTPIRNVPKVSSIGRSERAEARTLAPVEEEKIKAQKKTKVSEKTKKRNKIWAFATVGVLLLVAIFFIFNIKGQDEPFESFPERENEREPYENPEGAPQPPPIGQEGILKRVEEAHEWIQDDPEDPYAYLELALSLIEESPREKEGIAQSIKNATDNAGEDGFFFEDAGSALLDSGYWRGAASMFLHAVEISQKNGEDASYLMDPFHESIYRSAKLSEQVQDIPSERIAKIDSELMLIAEARYAFYHGEEAKAISILRKIEQQNPNYPEALLLEGEMHFQNEEYKMARQTLEALWDRPEMPYWIADEADNILNQIP